MFHQLTRLGQDLLPRLRIPLPSQRISKLPPAATLLRSRHRRLPLLLLFLGRRCKPVVWHACLSFNARRRRLDDSMLLMHGVGFVAHSRDMARSCDDGQDDVYGAVLLFRCFVAGACASKTRLCVDSCLCWGLWSQCQVLFVFFPKRRSGSVAFAYLVLGFEIPSPVPTMFLRRRVIGVVVCMVCPRW